MFLGLKEDMSVKRMIKIVGVVALVTLGTMVAWAGPLVCSQSPFGSYGTNSQAQYTPSGPAFVPPVLTTFCSSPYSFPLQSGPYPPATPDRPSFIAASGQQYLDTINWEVNPVDGVPNGNPNIYSVSPVFFNNGPGQGTGSAGNFPNPPYGGGVNGTGYSVGQVPSTAQFPNNGDNTDLLSITNQFGNMPTQQYANLLTGTLSGQGLGMNWDTSTTGAHYDPNRIDSHGHQCTTNYDQDPACWVPGTNTNAIITGVGFDIQMDQTNIFNQTVLGPFSVTFAIYGATPGCNDNSSAIITTAEAPDIQCYDYFDQQMTDNQGNDTSNDCATPDPNDLPCSGYNDSNVQLLGYVTVNSDTNGDPVFFGFTTNDPYGVGTVVLSGYSFNQAEGADVNFAINQVTLLTQSQNTPEPTTLLLFGSGLLVAARRLRKKSTVKA